MALCLSAAAVFIAGCGGDAIERRPIAGKVVGAEGQDGSLSFIPVGPPPRPAATTALSGGAYRFDTTNGPCSGEHDVLVVLGRRPEPLAPQPEQPTAASKTAPLPGPADAPPEREAEAEDVRVRVEVPGEGPWELDIELP